jgi:hypothetical protein
MSDIICYQFSRDLLEIGDAKNFHARFGKQRLPVRKQLGFMMNSLALMIEGYDDDPREIYASRRRGTLPTFCRFIASTTASSGT